MRIYLAGGVSGNLKPFWRIVAAMMSQGMSYEEAFDKAMKIYLAGGESRHWIMANYAGIEGGV